MTEKSIFIQLEPRSISACASLPDKLSLWVTHFSIRLMFLKIT